MRKIFMGKPVRTVGIYRKIKLYWAIEIDYKGGKWIQLAQDMMQQLSFMITTIKLYSTTERNVLIR